MSKTYLEYFVKSFPVEEVLNEWFVDLGGKKTLDPKKLPELKKSIEEHIIKDMKGKRDKGKLQKEKDEKEDQLNVVLAEIEKLNKEKRSLGTWANDSFDEYDTAIENAKGAGPAYDKEIKDKITRLREIAKRRKDLNKVSEELSARHITPDIVRKLSGEVVQLHNEHTSIFQEIRELIEEKKTGENPFSRSKETIESLTNKASRVWNAYHDKMIKDINRIEDLQDEEYKLENRIAELDEWLEEDSIPQDFINDGVRNFLAYLWHTIDEHWMRSVAAFQSRFNLNFVDYIEIREAFEKLIQHPVSSRASGRIIKELKQAIKFLRDKNKEVPSGYYEALAKLSKRPVKDVKKYEEEEKKENTEEKKETLKKSGLMSYRVACNFTLAL
jgi:predicted  nucleic acid-binding Zn-ribbon protein